SLSPPPGRIKDTGASAPGVFTTSRKGGFVVGDGMMVPVGVGVDVTRVPVTVTVAVGVCAIQRMCSAEPSVFRAYFWKEGTTPSMSARYQPQSSAAWLRRSPMLGRTCSGTQVAVGEAAGVAVGVNVGIGLARTAGHGSGVG